jgi:hypothetical protein
LPEQAAEAHCETARRLIEHVGEECAACGAKLRDKRGRKRTFAEKSEYSTPLAVHQPLLSSN